MAVLLCGCAKRCITPQVPVSLAGYFDVRMWRAILDEIEVRAVVLQQQDRMAAIVQFDLITVIQRLRKNCVMRYMERDLPEKICCS